MTRKFFFTAVLLVLASILYSQTNPNSAYSRKLFWEAVENSGSYIVEVKKNGAGDKDLLYRLETQNTFMEIVFLPGVYQYRVIVLNKFKKEISVTEWKRIEIRILKKPFFQTKNPFIAYKGTKKVSIPMDILYYSPECTVELLTRKSSIIGKQVSKEDSTFNYIFEFEIDSLPTGNYPIRVTNQLGRSDQIDIGLTIRPARTPVIFSISQKVTYTGEVLSSVVLKGSQFEQGLKLEAEAASGALISNVQVLEKDKVTFWLDLSKAVPGRYKITATNPSGKSSERTLLLIRPSDDWFKPSKIKTGISLSAGVPLMSGQLPTMSDISFLSGFFIQADFDFGGLTPFFKWMGFNIKTEYSAIGFLDVATNSQSNDPHPASHFINININLYYLSRSFDYVNIYAAIGAGFRLGTTSTNELFAEDPASLYEFNSKFGFKGIDILFNSALEWPLGDKVFIRTGAEFTVAITTEQVQLFPQVYLSFGYRFKEDIAQNQN